MEYMDENAVLSPILVRHFMNKRESSIATARTGNGWVRYAIGEGKRT
jgi:hypothetical protein